MGSARRGSNPLAVGLAAAHGKSCCPSPGSPSSFLAWGVWVSRCLGLSPGRLGKSRATPRVLRCPRCWAQAKTSKTHSKTPTEHATAHRRRIHPNRMQFRVRAFFTLGCFSLSAAAPQNTKQKERAGEREEGRKRSAGKRFAFFSLSGRAADKRQSEMPSWTFMGDLLCSRQCALAPGMSASWAPSKSPARQSETGFA